MPTHLPVTLSDSERIAVSAVVDLAALGKVATAEAVAAHVQPSVRFGVKRASRALGYLTRRGLVRRRRPKGSAFVYEFVRWPTDAERG